MVLPGFNFHTPLLIVILRNKLLPGGKSYDSPEDYLSDMEKALTDEGWNLRVHNSRLGMVDARKKDARMIYGLLDEDRDIKEPALCASLYSRTSEIGDIYFEEVKGRLIMINPAYHVGKLQVSFNPRISEN